MNDSLSPVLELRPVHLPPSPPFWPPAPGWWILTLLILIAAALLVRWLYRYYRLHRQRQRLLNALVHLGEQFAATGNASQLTAEISMLLRRIALSRFPRQRVAALSGADWLGFLDASGGNGRFSAGPGKVLAFGPYRPKVEVEAEALLILAREWIRKNS